jgi:hypothetical protein
MDAIVVQPRVDAAPPPRPLPAKPEGRESLTPPSIIIDIMFMAHLIIQTLQMYNDAVCTPVDHGVCTDDDALSDLDDCTEVASMLGCRANLS